MSTGTGTQQDPIVAMSADPAQIARDVRASLAHFNRTDDAYWLEKESAPAKFSNEFWHLGHNRYWETAMAPTDTGSRNPADGRLPALYLAPVVVVVPPPPDPPPMPPSPDTIASITLSRVQVLETQLASVVEVLTDLNTRLAAASAQLESVQTSLTTLALRPFPVYSGRAFGIASFTLTPVVPK